MFQFYAYLTNYVWPHAFHCTLCFISNQASLTKGESIFEMVGRTRNFPLGLLNYKQVKSTSYKLIGFNVLMSNAL